jgi:hypothetical protein
MLSRTRAFLAIVSMIVATPQASAQGGRPNADPDWPCQQIKTPTFSLAAIWAGPDIDLGSQAWRNEPEVADLAAKMTQRRVPIEEVEKAISDFRARYGADANARLLQAFGAAFEDLTQQRSQILDGLDRFGRKQRELANRIRAENAAVQTAADARKDESAAPSDDAQQQKLQWDLRVYDDRRKTIGYVCESPTLIEQRLGAIARAVQQAL